MNTDAYVELFRAYGGFDELGDGSCRRMLRLLSDLGQRPSGDDEWVELVCLVIGTGVTELLARLEHPDPQIRQMVTIALEWCWDDAAHILDVLPGLLDGESDPPVRAGLALAAARLASRLPFGEDRAAAEHWLVGLLDGRTDAAARFAAALGLAEHLRPPGQLVPNSVQDAIAATLVDGGAACVALWGDGWDTPLGAARTSLHGDEDATVGLLLKASHHPGLRAEVVRTASFLVTRPPEQVMALIPLLARCIRDSDPQVRESAARGLWECSGPALRGLQLDEPTSPLVVDMLAAALNDPLETVRTYAAYALARASDGRCVASLVQMLTRDELPDRLFEEMSAHAPALLPALRRRLSAVRPITVEFLDGGSTRVRGGLTLTDERIITGLAAWGLAAAPLAPSLRRILDLYLAETERCADRLSSDYYPLARGTVTTRRTLSRILGEADGTATLPQL